MEATWSWPEGNGIQANSGTGNYVLGLLGHGGSDPYQAYTSTMNAPAAYQTHEITNDIDVSSQVFPIGEQCEIGKFRLLGYKVGDTFEEAENADLVSTNPIFTNLDSDKYVIVANESCPTDIPIQCAEGYHEQERQCVKDEPEENNEEEEQGSGPHPLFGGRRHDVSGIFGGGQVLGASTDEGLMCEPYLNSYIKFGANNDPEEVKKLQIFLNQFFEVNNPVTGFYGPITYGMVKKFQKHQETAVLTPWNMAGMPTDATGYVYKTTKRWINILKCPEMIATNPVPSLP